MQIVGKEGYLYNSGVSVEFNLKAYNNEELLIKWLKEEFFLLCNTIGLDFLIVLN